MGDVKVKTDLTKLNRLEREFPGRVDRFMAKLAFDGQADLQLSYGSAGSPSAPGEPPGIDTGILKASIIVIKIKPKLYHLLGAAYGLYLEYGTATIVARPHILPMMKRAMRRVPDEAKGILKV